jgi:iron complex outermembrane receptor protein
MHAIYRANLGAGYDNQVLGGVFMSNRPNAHWGYNIGGQMLANNHTHANSHQQNSTLNVNIHHYGLDNHSSLNLISYMNNSDAPKESIWGEARQVGMPQTYAMRGSIVYGTNQHLFSNNSVMNTKIALVKTTFKTSMMSSSVTQHGLFFTNRWHRNHWLVGLDNRYNTYDANISGMLNKANGNIVSGFSRYHWRLNNRWSSILGARYAYQVLRAQGVVAPNVHENNQAWANEESLAYHVNHNWLVSLQHNQSYAFANGKDEIWRLPSEKTYAPLKTQTGHHYAFNVQWHTSVNKAKLSLYQIDLKNEMALDFPGGMSEMKNLPPTRRRGISVFNQWQMNQYWGVEAQAGYVDPRISSGVDKGKMIPGVSHWNGSLALSYQYNHHWLAQIEEDLHGPFYAAFDLKNQAAQMPGYGVTNIHLQKRNQRLIYGLSVNNLFNKHYVQFANYRSKFDNVAYYPADGLSILFHISINLKQPPASH